MNICILFILYSGYGYVTPACYADYGVLAPQDVVYLQHIPNHYIDHVWEAPYGYVTHFRGQYRYVHYRNYRAPRRVVNARYWKYQTNPRRVQRRIQRHRSQHWRQRSGQQPRRAYRTNWRSPRRVVRNVRNVNITRNINVYRNGRSTNARSRRSDARRGKANRHRGNGHRHKNKGKNKHKR